MLSYCTSHLCEKLPSGHLVVAEIVEVIGPPTSSSALLCGINASWVIESVAVVDPFVRSRVSVMTTLFLNELFVDERKAFDLTIPTSLELHEATKLLISVGDDNTGTVPQPIGANDFAVKLVHVLFGAVHHVDNTDTVGRLRTKKSACTTTNRTEVHALVTGDTRYKSRELAPHAYIPDDAELVLITSSDVPTIRRPVASKAIVVMTFEKTLAVASLCVDDGRIRCIADSDACSW